jgi:hypothetical protein
MSIVNPGVLVLESLVNVEGSQNVNEEEGAKSKSHHPLKVDNFVIEGLIIVTSIERSLWQLSSTLGIDKNLSILK